jgi:EAL domain-containing protein (putative c-di-GMP-specific phosphodiesterase class I)
VDKGMRMRQADGIAARGGDAPGGGRGPRYGVAFQPIVDIAAGRVRGYEALLRGPSGTPAEGVLARVPAGIRTAFEIEVLSAILDRFGAGEGDLHVNFSPAVLVRQRHAVVDLAARLSASALPPARFVIEVTEGERIGDAEGLAVLMREARARGFRVALDDFGTGYGGLGLLAEARPDLVKLDRSLIRGIHQHRARHPILARMLEAAGRLGIGAVAVGVETEAEFLCLASLGVTLFQGFLVSPPTTERLVRMEEIALPLAIVPAPPEAVAHVLPPLN